MNSLLAIAVGVLTGIGASVVSGYFGPRWLDEHRAQKNKSRLEPRAELLRKLLDDPDYTSRNFRTLRTVTGMKDEECRDLLIEIGARGVVTVSGNEAWALISRKPLKTAADENVADEDIG